MSTEAADKIQEAAESENKTFRNIALVMIAFFAMVAAVAGLGGANSGEEIVNNNILASDTWNFYQAKNIRQTNYRLSAEFMEVLLPTLPEAQQTRAQQRIDAYKSTVDRYESEPDRTEPENFMKGEGKKELLLRAQYYEERRDHAQKQDPNFDYSTLFLGIAIVLLTVATIAGAKLLLAGGFLVGLLGTMLMLNGFFLFLELPF